MNDQILFDKLTYIDRLKRAGIGEDEARAHGEALDNALRESVATKADVSALKADLLAVKNELLLAISGQMIKVGGMLVAAVAVLAAIKFFG
jgi:hypothetical protein